ncbi:hypothetical protein PM082_008420 [Marasmius tenuissimus]|nr:hypothetical protein PM082_008420 [Marasmius tenuissimus]
MLLNQSSSFDEASVPSDLTIPQFLLDQYEHPTRPKRPIDVPCLVDEDTGARLYIKDLRDRTRQLAAAINKIWNLNEEEIVSVMSPNHMNYAPCVWATHRLGGVVATLSPMLSVGELVHHLNISRPSLLFVHPDCVNVAAQAAEMIRLPSERIILITSSGSGSTTPLAFRTFEELVRLGRAPDCPPVIEKRLQPGEAKRRIAFLAPSSGTTGVQKAVAISHYNAISVIVQIATFNRIGEDYAPWAERRFRPGDVCCGFLPLYHIYGLVYNLHFILYAGVSENFVYFVSIHFIPDLQIGFLISSTLDSWTWMWMMGSADAY